MLPLLATYRVQLNADFPLARAAEIVPYLERLGVSHLYASPILEARPGSTHGYDVADPTRVSAELGGDEARRALAAELGARGMGMLLDIVPNHMSASAANPYWEDVLAHGRASRWAHWFDVDWDSPDPKLRGRVMLPVLGDHLRAVLDRGELQVVHQGGAFRLAYFEHTFPLAPESERAIVRAAPAGASRDEAAAAFAAGPRGRDRMQALLRQQHYRPAHWRRAAGEINYRRFFDVSELVALRAEDPRVFEETHRLVLDWVADGMVHGLRVDHVDGILDPLAYLRRLREAVGEGVPVFVEKILSPGEQLRDEWPVQGTTGYEVLNDIDTLFLHGEGVESIQRTYRALLPPARRARDFHEVAHEGKVDVLRGSLAADARRLARQLLPIARGDQRTGGADEDALRGGIVELIAALPVYRTYVDERGPSDEDVRLVERAAAEAWGRGEASPAVVSLLEDVLLLRREAWESAERARRLHFARRFQQVSGPATAKGVEDTALYRYAPLVSRNEVGGDPTRPLADAAALVHAANAERRRRWPRALVATNTHDTKRGADVRARVNVLTELPGVWHDCVVRWVRAHRALKPRLGRRRAPDVYSEYLLYQTLVGVWPLAGASAAGGAGGDLAQLAERVKAYMLKAVRESKSRTSWTEGDEAFERALAEFIDTLLLDERGRQFRSEVTELVARVGRPGLWSALSRVVVHLAGPGTPDLYQGDELWGFTLVDPDNRRPVDYALRARLLDEAERAVALDPAARAGWLAGLLERPEDGRVKLHLTHRLLQARRRWPGLFRDGSYEPVVAEGERAAHLFAFLRRGEGRAALAVAPRLLAALSDGGRAPTGPVWSGTRLPLPAALAGLRWECALTGRTVAGDGAALLAADALATFPVALLTAEAPAG